MASVDFGFVTLAYVSNLDKIRPVVAEINLVDRVAGWLVAGWTSYVIMPLCGPIFQLLLRFQDRAECGKNSPLNNYFLRVINMAGNKIASPKARPKLMPSQVVL